MYMLPDMIDLGFQHDEEPKWTSEDHKTVAMNVCLCNPRVTTRDSLIDMVAKINKIPQERIRTVTLNDLRDEFEVPNLD